ncbi:ABC-2 type transport system ATP-binding protein [Fontibacillus phaseoli]|uniref:ABC-2 type transport system ATP-binding protein n=1 Tax=Fontibacillus phaseoli TaxID=1416533 RepID=A0A369BPJ6_9BACL|nr:ABC transporter ATP-binding protein [Fontibacillus phaseoli]RCX21584.1 ABC-2 type transport system ATP-binding protein [Fontibacillus phaseoli]
MPVLQIDHLTKKIGKKTIVDDVSLNLNKGEILGLLGPNGAGKTTTIRMIVGLMSKTAGTIVINGVDPQKDYEKAMSNIGVIVENPDLYKYLSGYDNLIHFSRMSKGISEQRIKDIIALVGLEHSIHEKVSTYSLGMRQRLGLAVALVHSPSLLLLDEPTNGLDPAGIRELRAHLIHLARHEEVGIMISSHLMSEMELMCDRVAVLQQGKLIGIRDLAGAKQVSDLQVQFEVDRPELAVQILQTLTVGQEIGRDNNHVLLRIAKSKIPEFTQKLMEAGIQVYGVNTLKPTLEDTFLEMTEGDNKNDSFNS